MNWTELTWTDLQQVGPISAKFHYTDTDRTRPGRTRPDKVRGLAGDTGHSPTKSALARLVQFRLLDAFIDHARQRHDSWLIGQVCRTPWWVWAGCSSPFLKMWARRWINDWNLWRMASATPALRLPSQPQGTTAPWPVPNYTAWWQRHMCANNFPRLLPKRPWIEPATVQSQVQRSKSSHHHDTQLIGCGETRTVGAQSVLNTRIPMRLFTTEFADSSRTEVRMFCVCVLWTILRWLFQMMIISDFASFSWREAADDWTWSEGVTGILNSGRRHPETREYIWLKVSLDLNLNYKLGQLCPRIVE